MTDIILLFKNTWWLYLKCFLTINAKKKSTVGIMIEFIDITQCTAQKYSNYEKFYLLVNGGGSFFFTIPTFGLICPVFD